MEALRPSLEKKLARKQFLADRRARKATGQLTVVEQLCTIVGVSEQRAERLLQYYNVETLEALTEAVRNKRSGMVEVAGFGPGIRSKVLEFLNIT
jgi:hypothetical protein